MFTTDSLAHADSLELLAMFEAAAAIAQAEYEASETEEEKFERAVRNHAAEEFFASLQK